MNLTPDGTGATARWNALIFHGAKSKDPEPRPARAFSGGNFPPDIPLTSLGKREEHFRGGTGQTLEWPSIGGRR